jgi:HEAT repeat protein
MASPMPLLRARSARALGSLGERRLVPELLRRLDGDRDVGERIAYASALGQLRAQEAAEGMLKLADQMPSTLWMSELNLALSRLAGDERFFVQLWRQMRSDPSTPSSRAMDKCVKALRRRRFASADMVDLARQVSGALARHEFSAAGELLAKLVAMLPEQSMPRCLSAILKDSAERVRQGGPAQMETLPLALHCLAIACGAK